VPTLAEALAAIGDSRVMVDLCGPVGRRTVARVLDVVRQCGAGDRVYYSAHAEAMLAVRAAEPSAEIALTWTSLAPPRPAVLAAIRPRWLNYRFSLLDRDLAARVHRDGYLLSAWTPDTRRAMRRLLALGVDSITTNRVDVLHTLRTTGG
jgi:glycerophosphoryl diester phosphodiesterase